MTTSSAHPHIGTEQTVDFVKANSGAGTRLLDVGCGDGLIANELVNAGYVVMAIDASEEAVRKTRLLGVNAKQCDLLELPSEPFEVILLSRSLHHIHPIESAITKLQSLLVPEGVLLIEEFGAELIDRRSALWLYGLKSIIPPRSHDHKGHGPQLEDGAIPQDPVASWHEHHFGKHQVIESGVLLAALEQRFEITKAERIAYLYRYFVDDLTYEQGRRLMEWETRLCEQDLLTQIGLRIVATQKTGGINAR